MSKERKPRPVRLNEEEWEAFRRLLGSVWLRSQIERAIKRDQRKTTAHKEGE